MACSGFNIHVWFHVPSIQHCPVWHPSSCRLIDLWCSLTTQQEPHAKDYTLIAVAMAMCLMSLLGVLGEAYTLLHVTCQMNMTLSAVCCINPS